MNDLFGPRSRRRPPGVLLASWLLLASCAQAPDPRLEVGDRIDQTMTQAQAGPQSATPPAPGRAHQEDPIPPEVGAALLPPIPLGPDEGDQTGESRYDLSATDLPARELFMSLVSGTRYNAVVHPDVTQKVTIDLKNASILEALEALRALYGFQYQWISDNHFLVHPPALSTRVFQVNYLNVVRNGASRTSINIGKARTSDDNQSGSGSSSSSNSGSGSGTEEADYGNQVVTHHDTDFWTELTAAVSTVVGDKEGRKVSINPHSGTVIIRAMPDELMEVERMLAAIQGNLDRQVILEAKIIEVELADGYRQGINWAAMAQPNPRNTGIVAQTGGGPILGKVADLGVDASEMYGLTGTLAGGALISSVQPFGGAFAMNLALNDFGALIELLETQGTVQVLSSPRVSTVNNQKAVIKMGEDEYFVTEVESNDTTSSTDTGTSNRTMNLTLTPFFSGIALDVTPQVSEEGFVTLHIHPMVSEVRDQIKSFTTSGLDQVLPLAHTEIRESDSIVRAANGQVVVIGGLMRVSRTHDAAGTPLLGALPVVGNLFKHREERGVKSELVILLRPVVVDNQQVWSEQIRQTADRLKGMRPRPQPGFQIAPTAPSGASNVMGGQ